MEINITTKSLIEITMSSPGMGADLVVIGRPIIEAQDLNEALSKTKKELGE